MHWYIMIYSVDSGSTFRTKVRGLLGPMISSWAKIACSIRNDFVCLFVLSNKFLSRYQVQLGFSQQPRGYLFDWTSGEASTRSQFNRIERVERNSLGSGVKWHHEAANNSTWWANLSTCCAYISLSRWSCLQSLDYRPSHFFLGVVCIVWTCFGLCCLQSC